MTTHTVINPATEQPVAEVAGSTAEQADAAIERAAVAQQSWRSVAPGDRARLLRRFAEQVDAHIAELAGLETAGSGHPVGAATWEAGQVRDVRGHLVGEAPEQPGPVAGSDVAPALLGGGCALDGRVGLRSGALVDLSDGLLGGRVDDGVHGHGSVSVSS